MTTPRQRAHSAEPGLDAATTAVRYETSLSTGSTSGTVPTALDRMLDPAVRLRLSVTELRVQLRLPAREADAPQLAEALDQRPPARPAFRRLAMAGLVCSCHVGRLTQACRSGRCLDRGATTV
jgi:hypothetical protein